MNTIMLTGRLTKDATLNGQKKKALTFYLACKHGWDSKEKKDRIEFIPCVMFNPSDGITDTLMKEGKGTLVELKGRLSCQSYQVNDEKRFKTEVVVENSSFNLLKKSNT